MILGVVLVFFYCCFCFCISMCMRTMQRGNYSKIVHKNRPYLPLSTIEDENGYILPIPESTMTSVLNRASRPKYVVPDISKYQRDGGNAPQEDHSSAFAPPNSSGDGPANSFILEPSSPEYNGNGKPQDIKLVATGNDSDDDDESDDGNEPPPPYNPNFNQYIQDEKPMANSDDDDDDDDDDEPPPPYNPNLNQHPQDEKPMENSDDDNDEPPPPYGFSERPIISNNADDEKPMVNSDDDDDNDESSLPPPPYNPNTSSLI